MTTINQDEIQKFSRLADEWWDANGKFKPLHSFNPIRLKYIIDKCTSHFKLKNIKKNILYNLKILDIGCGGGLICEPLARLGGKVTGIDASYKNIEIAKIHAKRSHLKINYLCTSPEQYKLKDKFDVVLNLEVVEHVENLDLFLKSASSLLKKDGIIIIGLYHKYGRFFTKLKQKMAKVLGYKISFFDKTSRGIKSSEKKNSWVKDQFFNPHETVHTPKEVLNWFKENNIEFLNLIPHYDISNNKLLKKNKLPNLSKIDEFMMAFDRTQIKEGGFFVMVGRKK